MRIWKRSNVLKAFLAASTTMISVPLSCAYAQSASSAASQLNLVAFDIPAQPLASALVAFAQKSGLKLAYSASLSQGRVAPVLTGSYTNAQALGRLLAGSGLTYRFSGPAAVTIEQPQQSGGAVADVPGAITLDTVDVNGGNAQSPYGPGVGYIATESVTGTKTDTPIIEIPQSISVVTRRQMDDQQSQTVAEAFRYTAGIMPEAYGVAANYTDSYLYVRGFKPDVYLDALKTVPLSSTDSYLLERAELIHGPTSVLYGQASPGGLIDLVSKRPMDTPFHEIQIGVGSYGKVQTNFDLSGPVNTDSTLLYRLTGIAFTGDTQVDQTKDQRVAMAPALTWRPDASTSLTVLASYTYDPALGAFSALPAIGTALPNAYGQIPRSFFVGDSSFNTWRRDQASIGYAFEHYFNPVLTFRQNARFSYLDSTEKHLYPSGLEANLQTIDRYAYLDLNKRSSFDLDDQAEAHFATGPITHKALLGLDYQYLHLDESYQLGLVPSINYLLPNTMQLGPAGPTLFSAAPYAGKPVTVQNQLGLYAQDQVKLEKLSFVIGGREDWASSDVDDSVAKTYTHMFDQAATWRAGLIYEFEIGLAPYASYSTSFQPQTGTAFDGTAFKPTTGQQYEVGLKYQPIGYNSFITVSAFDLTQQDVLTTDPNHSTFSVQTGAIRSKGIEFEAHGNLTEDFSLIATYSYLNNVVTAANNGTVGKHPVGIPTDMASFWADYTFHQGPLSGLGLAYGVRYVGPSYGTASNKWGIAGYAATSSKISDYTLFDAAVRYDFTSNWRLAVNVTNLLDEKYVSSCLSASTCYYGSGRMVLATLRYRW